MAAGSGLSLAATDSGADGGDGSAAEVESFSQGNSDQRGSLRRLCAWTGGLIPRSRSRVSPRRALQKREERIERDHIHSEHRPVDCFLGVGAKVVIVAFEESLKQEARLRSDPLHFGYHAKKGGNIREMDTSAIVLQECGGCQSGRERARV
jgi:hypothetical protein